MRFLIVDNYYSDFLAAYRPSNTGSSSDSYHDQLSALLDQCFGTSDFYSYNLRALGHEVADTVVNYEPLQRAWWRENRIEPLRDRASYRLRLRRGFVPWLDRDRESWQWPILREQIKSYRPDVLHIHDMIRTPAAFLREIRPYVRLIVGQIACPVRKDSDFSPYDLILTSFPHFVERFRSQGLSSEYLRLAFDPRILPRLVERQPKYDVVFVGGLAGTHSDRMQMLEAVAKKRQLDIWGYGVESLPPTSILRKYHHGEAWSLDMYQILSDSRIALNHHIDVAENYANNMRLYEATGVGTLLVTDNKINLPSLFVPGEHVIDYSSPDECAEKVNYYLDHEQERSRIAAAGQKHTLAEHSYGVRMQEYSEIIARYLRS